MKTAHKPIDSINLFNAISEHERDGINKICSWSEFSAGQEILHQDDRTTDIFFIAEGSVSAKSFSQNGKEVTYLEITAGNIFGEFSAIDEELRSATITTTAPSLIGRIRSDQFKQLLKSHPDLSLSFAAHLVAKIRHLSNRIYQFSTLSVRCRLHSELLDMCEVDEANNIGIIEKAPTHYELATHISTHREAISREISWLVSHKILVAEGRKFIICDLARLHELVELART